LQRDSLKLNGKELSVNRAVPKNIKTPGAHERTKKLFIANLPKATSEDELRAYFESRHPKKYGTIELIKLVKKKNDDGTEESKGYGFVEVSSEDMADKMAIQHSTFHFGGRKIELKKSVPTNDGSGRGRGRGGKMGMRGGGNFGYGGYGGYGGYDASYGAGAYGYGGYDAGFGYGGGYGAPRGRGRGGARFTPY